MIAVLRNLSACRLGRLISSKVLENVNLNLISRKNKLNFQINVSHYCAIMKLDSSEFKSIFTPELKGLAELFEKYGYEIRVAGGAVRDLLSGKIPNDLDFATTATPQQMKEMFSAENVRMINMNGEKHGTITPRINDKENFEVTTLRIDEVTDGRHAQVKFTTDWKLDANRRDLTINSMFLGLDGTVYDYFNGYEDLKKRRVVFVGDARTRIQEDYLRILRYFRFYGRIASDPNSHEEDTLRAIQEHLEGLNRISGERIWTELKKILTGNFAGELITTMLDLGMSSYIGLPKEPNKTQMNKLWKQSKNYRLQAMAMIAALLYTEQEMMDFHARIKLSAYERDLGLFLITYRSMKENSKPLRQYQTIVLTSKLKQSDVKEWVRELLKYKGDIPTMEEFDRWKIPKFPLSGNMLMSKGAPGGKRLGPVINKLKELWIESDFTANDEELLQKLPEVLHDLDTVSNGVSMTGQQ